MRSCALAKAGAAPDDRAVDARAQAAASKVAWSLPISTIAKQREDMENLCVHILTAYRRHCAARSSNEGQLILPESLKLLPLYMCMFFKSRQLSVGPPDGRAAALAAHLCATPRRFAMTVKPRLIDVQVRVQPVCIHACMGVYAQHLSTRRCGCHACLSTAHRVHSCCMALCVWFTLVAWRIPSLAPLQHGTLCSPSCHAPMDTTRPHHTNRAVDLCYDVRGSEAGSARSWRAVDLCD